ncbi:hypothetical protein [Tessaracoccus coleopterorum]
MELTDESWSLVRQTRR